MRIWIKLYDEVLVLNASHEFAMGHEIWRHISWKSEGLDVVRWARHSLQRTNSSNSLKMSSIALIYPLTVGFYWVSFSVEKGWILIKDLVVQRPKKKPQMSFQCLNIQFWGMRVCPIDPNYIQVITVSPRRQLWFVTACFSCHATSNPNPPNLKTS
jgi:hypothetical protein